MQAFSVQLSALSLKRMLTFLKADACCREISLNGMANQFIMDLFRCTISNYNRRMRSRLFVITGIAAAALLVFLFHRAPSVLADDGTVAYPEGYRSWTFLHGSLVPAGAQGFSKSPCVKPCTNGIFYFYANEPALKGLQTGTYADGAVIAEELLEFRVGEKGNGGEGRRVLTAVMAKDSQRYAATGGWGFGKFDEGSKVNTLDAKAQQACFQCHIPRKDRGYVFTKYDER